jgi:hypothetical protein
VFWAGGGDWNSLAQFGDAADFTNTAGLGINAADFPVPHLQLNSSRSGRYDLGAVQFDHWYHVVVRAFWSTDPARGEFDVELDGAPRVALREQTIKDTTVAKPGFTAPGAGPISVGFYGHADNDVTVWHDGFCRASSYATAASC